MILELSLAELDINGVHCLQCSSFYYQYLHTVVSIVTGLAPL
jgi:hypothetical protein